MKVLVTGGAGFIGSHIVELLQGRAAVTVLDNFRTGFPANLAGLDCDVVEGSVTDRAAVRRAAAGARYVFHLAAMVSVPESMADPIGCVDINTTGTLIVLEEAAAAGVEKLCFSSTAAIYGNSPAEVKEETANPDPLSPYAITKLDGEYYCQMFQRQGRLKTVSLRYFNVFGPRQDPNGAYAAVVPSFIQAAITGQPLCIDGDGEQTRDFISVRDVAAANLHLASLAETPPVVNVARGGRVSVNELARLISSSVPSLIQHRPARPGDVRHSCASTARLTATGFRPAHHDLAPALLETKIHLAARLQV